MRLYELYTINHLPIKGPVGRSDFRAFKEQLIAHGFKPLGTGASGTVFTSEQLGYAVKLFLTEDRGYRTFLDYVFAHGSNPHLPRFRGRIKQINDGCSACRMELLQPVDDHSMEYFETVDEWAVRYLSGSTDVLGRVSDTDTPLFDTLVDLHHLIRTKRLEYDMHENNIMLRGSTVVITDPFAV